LYLFLARQSQMKFGLYPDHLAMALSSLVSSQGCCRVRGDSFAASLR